MRYLEQQGAKLSVIGLGTWQFGSREWGYGRDYADKEAVEIVHRALDLGINVIDTAEIYALGASERIVGRALHDRRPEAFVATKLFPVLPVPPVLRMRADASRRRLGVEQIDLYQIHWRNPLFPVGLTVQGLGNVLDDGSVAHAGVSNFSLEDWQAAEAALGRPVLSNQVQFSLAHPGPLTSLVPWACDNGRVVIAFSPLCQGLLSARYGPDNPPSGGVRAGNPLFLPENLERASTLLGTLREVAAAHDATPAQIALAWLVHRPNVIVIPGASSVAQVESNAAAVEIALADDEDAALTKAAQDFEPLGGFDAALRLIRRRLPLPI